MAQKQYRPEEIIGKLREAEALLSQGVNVEEVCRKIEVTKVTFYRWRKEYGRLRVDQARLGVKTLYIEPGSPWENGYIESFNGKLRDEFLNRELLDTLLEARVLTARWRQEYNTFRPHSALNYRPPAPEAFEPLPVGPAPLHPQVADAA